VGDIALAALIGVIGLAAGIVVSTVGQLIAGRQALRREREARLFDARRQAYAEALQEIGQHLPRPFDESAPVTQDDVNALRRYVLGSEVHLLGSPKVRETFTDLMVALHRTLQTERDSDPDQARRGIPQPAAGLIVESIRELTRLMHADLGVGPASTRARPTGRFDFGFLSRVAKEGHRWRDLRQHRWRARPRVVCGILYGYLRQLRRSRGQ